MPVIATTLSLAGVPSLGLQKLLPSPDTTMASIPSFTSTKQMGICYDLLGWHILKGDSISPFAGLRGPVSQRQVNAAAVYLQSSRRQRCNPPLGCAPSRDTQRRSQVTRLSRMLVPNADHYINFPFNPPRIVSLYCSLAHPTEQYGFHFPVCEDKAYFCFTN